MEAFWKLKNQFSLKAEKAHMLQVINIHFQNPMNIRLFSFTGSTESMCCGAGFQFGIFIGNCRIHCFNSFATKTFCTGLYYHDLNSDCPADPADRQAILKKITRYRGAYNKQHS